MYIHYDDENVSTDGSDSSNRICLLDGISGQDCFTCESCSCVLKQSEKLMENERENGLKKHIEFGNLSSLRDEEN